MEKVVLIEKKWQKIWLKFGLSAWKKVIKNTNKKSKLHNFWFCKKKKRRPEKTFNKDFLINNIIEALIFN